MQVVKSLVESSNIPIIIHGMFGIGKTSLATDVALEQNKKQHVFWLHFGADCQKSKDNYATKVLAQQRDLYKQITGDNPQVCGLQVEFIPVQSQ